MILVTKTSDQTRQVCVCVVILFNLAVRLMDAPAGVTQEEGHTGFIHLSVMPASIFIVRRIQSSLFLVDREVEFCVYPRINFSPLVGHDIFYFLFCEENPRSRLQYYILYIV